MLKKLPLPFYLASAGRGKGFSLLMKLFLKFKCKQFLNYLFQA